MSGRVSEEWAGTASKDMGTRPGPSFVERTLPMSKDAEAAVLGSFLLSPDEAGAAITERLTESHFYLTPHKVIFREIVALQNAVQAVDLVTVTQRLQNKNQLDAIGGPSYLA